MITTQVARLRPREGARSFADAICEYRSNPLMAAVHFFFFTKKVTAKPYRCSKSCSDSGICSLMGVMNMLPSQTVASDDMLRFDH